MTQPRNTNPGGNDAHKINTQPGARSRATVSGDQRPGGTRTKRAGGIPPAPKPSIGSVQPSTVIGSDMPAS